MASHNGDKKSGIGKLMAEEDKNEKQDEILELMTELEKGKDQWMQELKVTHLPYFTEKFGTMAPRSKATLSFIEDDEFGTTFKYLDRIHQHTLQGGDLRLSQRRSKLVAILAIADGIYYAFRKLLEIIFDNCLTVEGFSEPHHLATSFLTSKTTHLLINATDLSHDFSRRLCNEPDFLELLVSFLKRVKDWHLNKTRINESSEDVLENILNILYNCSMHDENRQRILDVGGLEACLPYLDSHSETNQQLATFCVAYLANEKQSEIFKAKKELIQSLVNLLESAINSPAHRWTSRSGWHAEELAKGLGALSQNDVNKRLIIDCGAINVLLGAVLQNVPPDVQEEAMQVIWTLSFHNDAKVLLKHKEGAMELFTQMASTVPDHRCKRAAEGIRWALKDAEEHRQKKESPQPGPQQQHIMISYKWDCRPLVLKVKNALKAAGYKVWMDVDDMEGSLYEAMADAVEKSAVFLMCFSHLYKVSPMCRLEAVYANERRKEIIPLLAEAGYKPDGWLGILKGDKLHYDITNDNTFEENMQRLVKALRNKGKLDPSQQAARP